MKIVVIFLALLAVFFFSLSIGSLFGRSKFTYPTVRRDDTKDNLFGTIVPDPYRWLEDAKSEATAKFVKDQNKLTMEFIRKNAHWMSVKKRYPQIQSVGKGIIHKFVSSWGGASES